MPAPKLMWRAVGNRAGGWHYHSGLPSASSHQAQVLSAQGSGGMCYPVGRACCDSCSALKPSGDLPSLPVPNPSPSPALPTIVPEAESIKSFILASKGRNSPLSS